MRIFVRIAFILVALVNLAPVLGVISAARLESLYGIQISDPNLEILLRHRAVLFAVVGVLLLLAAFRHSLRPLAVSLGLLSMLSFVAVAVLVGNYGPEIGRIVLIDIGASTLLIVAALGSRLDGGQVSRTSQDS